MPRTNLNIALTGFMGTGKTSVALELSRMTGRPIIDMDAEIEKKAGIPITEIFSRFGEAHFRNMESEEAREAGSRKGVIISTGGGVVLRKENMAALRKNGVIVRLQASPEAILERTSKTSDRPLLQAADPLARIKDLLSKREPFYQDADITVDTEGKSPRETAGEILEKLKEIESKTGAETDVRVELAERSYSIRIGSGILSALGEALKKLGLSRQIGVVSNPAVNALYGKAVLDSLRSAGFEPLLIEIPDGEEYKNLDSANRIYTALLQARFDRGSALLALGGGVIGDLTGFAASTYMRGIRFVQVPTTLLAHVDSSVGGKTGVNHPLGKNMIGTFWQPSLVWIDISTLRTLPDNQLAAGMAEVIKYGVIKDAEFFACLEKERDRIARLAPDALSHIIQRSCEIKAEVVSLDEREAGLRAILNFGHTIGHAIETLTGYTRYLHGEAVAIGMCMEAKIAQKRGLISREGVQRLEALVKAYGLPASMPSGLPADALFAAMQVDKKASGGQIKVVLPEKIGSVRVEAVSHEEFDNILAY